MRENNVELVQDILKELSPIAHSSQAANELVRILKEPHFQVRAQCSSEACGLSVWWLVNVTLGAYNGAYRASTHCKHGLNWSPVNTAVLQRGRFVQHSIARACEDNILSPCFVFCFFSTGSLSWKLMTLWLPKTTRPLPPAPVPSWMQPWITSLFPQTQSGWLAFAKCPVSTWWVWSINALVCAFMSHCLPNNPFSL